MVDDIAYSGEQLRIALDKLRDKEKIPREQIFVGSMAMTDTAYQILLRRAVNISTSFRVPQWHEGFSESDIENLQRLFGHDLGRRIEMGAEAERTLTFPWYKFPDRLLPELEQLNLVPRGDYQNYLGNPRHAPDYQHLLQEWEPKQKYHKLNRVRSTGIILENTFGVRAKIFLFKVLGLSESHDIDLVSLPASETDTLHLTIKVPNGEINLDFQFDGKVDKIFRSHQDLKTIAEKDSINDWPVPHIETMFWK